jgi:hypothetical protein
MDHELGDERRCLATLFGVGSFEGSSNEFR